MVQGQAGEVPTATREELLVLGTLPGGLKGEGYPLHGLCPTPGCVVLLLSCFLPVQLLESTGHLQILSKGQVLQIKPASVSDSGHYTCVATNAVGEDDRDFIVHVQGEPWVASQCLEEWVSQQDEESWGLLWEQSRPSRIRVCLCWKMSILLALVRPGQMLWLHLGV